MKDRYGNAITVGSTFEVIGGNTIHIGELAIVQEICEEAQPPYLVGSFEDREPVLQIGIGKEPVVDMELRFPMTVYPHEIEVEKCPKG